MEEKETFASRLASKRKAKGFTQEQLAEKMGVSPQAVSKWETGASYPDITLLSDLATVLDTSIDELLGKKEPAPEVEVVNLEKRKDINSMFLRVKVVDTDDRVSINLPMSIVVAALKAGAKPTFSGNDTLNSIDFKAIIDLVEQGVVGKIMEVNSKDGATVEIYVE